MCLTCEMPFFVAFWLPSVIRECLDKLFIVIVMQTLVLQLFTHTSCEGKDLHLLVANSWQLKNKEIMDSPSDSEVTSATKYW
jgi:hypothetical protein